MNRDVPGSMRQQQPGAPSLPGTNGRHYLTRVLLYRTVRNVHERVVVTFTDVTQLKHAEQLSLDARIYAESVVDTVREPLLVLGADLLVESANKSFCRTFGVTADQTLNRSVFELGERQWDVAELRRLLTGIVCAGLLPTRQRIYP